MKAALYIAIAVMSAIAWAQVNPKDAPALTATEKAAYASVYRSINDNQQEHARLMQELHALEADTKVTHPGYHLDEASGTLVKDEKKPAEEPKK